MQQGEMYICDNICGEGKECQTMIEIVNQCDCCNDVPQCCGKPMRLLEEKTMDQGAEKHVPVILPADGGYEVRVGDLPHPMLPKHYISMIELRTADAIYRKYLQPEDDPAAFFPTNDEPVNARAYCNVHGLWASKQENS